jgi:uncharacterized protein (DUF885 family)
MNRSAGLLGIVLFLASACASMPRGAAAPQDAADPELRVIVAAYFDAAFAFSPTWGTESGFHQYDGRLDDLSRGRIQARIVELESFRERLRALSGRALTLDDEVDASALLGNVESELLDLKVLRRWELNPMLYAGLPGSAVDSIIKRDYAPKAQRIQGLIARLRAVPAFYAAAKENLTHPPREFTEIALGMAEGSVDVFELSLPAWANDPACPPEARAALAEASSAAAAAARDFSRWLREELLPRSTGSFVLGEAHFRAKLWFDEQVETPLPELLALGEAQLARDLAAFTETARQIDPSRSPAEVARSLSDEHPSASELVSAIASSLESARRFVVDKQLLTLPSDTVPRVLPMPDYLRVGGFAGLNTPGPYETGATDAFYYVTTVQPDWDAQRQEEHLRLFNPYIVASITFHEAFPGHFTQFLYAARYKTRARRLMMWCPTNAKGWAHYAEQLMVDEGFGAANPRYRLAQLQEALVRDVRFVVSIKLHTQGMSVAEASRLFEEKAFQEPANAYEEARRGTWNATYLFYTLGKLQIQALRDEYRAKTGASLAQFHDAFLSTGTMPIPLVRKLILGPVAGPRP